MNYRRSLLTQEKREPEKKVKEFIPKSYIRLSSGKKIILCDWKRKTDPNLSKIPKLPVTKKGMSIDEKDRIDDWISTYTPLLQIYHSQFCEEFFDTPFDTFLEYVFYSSKI